jgi:cold shock CspA family protein/ribosome-associated translation inhibitor RaiA
MIVRANWEAIMTQIPLQVSFRNMDAPMGVEDKIREKVEALERFYPRITGCRVVVERRHHRHRTGDLFHVRIDVTVPGAQLMVNREPPEHHAHEEVLVALHDAFDEIRRQLQDQVRKARGTVKAHEVPPHGRIVRLFPYEGYGFIEDDEGKEVYFQRESVVEGGFNALEVGDEVRYFSHPGEGEKGEQASTVTPMGKHHPPAHSL